MGVRGGVRDDDIQNGDEQKEEEEEEEEEPSPVQATLRRVWADMLTRGTLIVFELWCNGTMVAADFGHPVGASFYVATRWHDPALSKHQTGFVLALASARVLQRKWRR